MNSGIPKKLILGIGNEILTDDGIANKIVKKLENDISIPALQFNTIANGGLEILDHIQGYDQLIIIDATITPNGKPGDIYQFPLSDYQETLHLSSFHDANFPTTISTGRTLELHIPEDIHIIAIEIEEYTVFNNSLSDILQKKFEYIYTTVKKEIESFFNQKSAENNTNSKTKMHSS